MIFGRRALLGSVLAFGAAGIGSPAYAAAPVVRTRPGRVRGSVSGGVSAYLGIPYAAPPTGARRFLPPTLPLPWVGVRDCIEYAASCPQIVRIGPPIFKTFGSEARMDENCLALNVWTRGGLRKRPVMVWLHGGGFANWSGSSPRYAGAELARTDRAVVITLNHRLNIFGFLNLTGAGIPTASNAGMLDIVCALEWVRDNIAAFGGDPANVTIFGESGGGAKVATLLAMPAAKELFHKAIIESGPLLRGVSQARADAAAKTVMAALGTTDPARLTEATTAQLLDALAKAGRPHERAFGPVVDGHTLPAHPFEPVASPVGAHVPLVIGTNLTETRAMLGDPGLPIDWDALPGKLKPFIGAADPVRAISAYRTAMPRASANEIFYLMTTRLLFGSNSDALADAKAAQPAPVWRYELGWQSEVDGGKWGAPHTVEIPLVFKTFEGAEGLVGRGERVARMSAILSETWLQFAETGNPDNRLIPHWPRYTVRDRQQMTFDLASQVQRDPKAFSRDALAGAPLTAITD